MRKKYEQDLEEVREMKNYLKDYFTYKEQKSNYKKKMRKNSPEGEYRVEYKVKI